MNTGSSENDGKDNSFTDPNGEPYSMVITCNLDYVPYFEQVRI